MKYGLPNTVYNQIKEIVEQYKNYQFKIFGSRARGDYKENSDIDIAIFGNVSEKEKFNILNDFDKINIPYTIDTIFVKEIKKIELIESIEKDKKDF